MENELMKQHHTIYVIKTQHHFMINYCYLIVENQSRQTAIIDPSWDLRLINHHIEKLSAKLSSIFITHHHIDHMNLVEALVVLYNTDVYMHEKEIKYYGLKNLKNLVGLKNSQKVRIDKTVVECLHTPGHTAGGACYLLDDCVFTGDTLFIEGCGVCTLHGGNVEEMYKSIALLKNRIDPMSRIYPGHAYAQEPGCTFKEMMKRNVYMHFNKKDFIKFRMRKNQYHFFDFR